MDANGNPIPGTSRQSYDVTEDYSCQENSREETPDFVFSSPNYVGQEEHTHPSLHRNRRYVSPLPRDDGSGETRCFTFSPPRHVNTGAATGTAMLTETQRSAFPPQSYRSTGPGEATRPGAPREALRSRSYNSVYPARRPSSFVSSTTSSSHSSPGATWDRKRSHGHPETSSDGPSTSSHDKSPRRKLRRVSIAHRQNLIQAEPSVTTQHGTKRKRPEHNTTDYQSPEKRLKTSPLPSCSSVKEAVSEEPNCPGNCVCYTGRSPFWVKPIDRAPKFVVEIPLYIRLLMKCWRTIQHGASTRAASTSVRAEVTRGDMIATATAEAATATAATAAATRMGNMITSATTIGTMQIAAARAAVVAAK